MKTKAQIKTELKARKVAFRAKANLAELQALLDAAPPSTRKPSVKSIIRSLFPSQGAQVAVEAVFNAIRTPLPSTKDQTVYAMVSDLKNKKYCGPEGLFVLERDGDKFVRIQ